MDRLVAENFLEELTALCNKHKLLVDTCPDCGSLALWAVKEALCVAMPIYPCGSDRLHVHCYSLLPEFGRRDDADDK